MLEMAIQMARADGYDSAVYDGEWEGYRVYLPIFLDGEPHYLGIPRVILEKDGALRFGKPSENMAYLEFKTPSPSDEMIKKALEILNETA